MVRFLLIGLANTAFSFGIYSAFVLVGIHFAASNLFALILGIGFSYLTNGSIVFYHLSRKSLIRYILMWCAIYLIQISIIYTLISCGWHSVIGGFTALVVAVPISFLLQKYYVFQSEC